jgi:hypothetical protein
MAEKYNTLVIRLKVSELQEFIDNGVTRIHDFEGKGHPDFITLVLEEDEL